MKSNMIQKREGKREKEKGEKQNGGQACQTLAYNRNMAWLIPLQSYKPGQLEQSSCLSKTMGHSAVYSFLTTHNQRTGLYRENQRD